MIRTEREIRLEMALLAAMRDVDVWSRYPPNHPLAGRELLWHELARRALLWYPKDLLAHSEVVDA